MFRLKFALRQDRSGLNDVDHHVETASMAMPGKDSYPVFKRKLKRSLNQSHTANFRSP